MQNPLSVTMYTQRRFHVLQLVYDSQKSYMFALKSTSTNPLRSRLVNGLELFSLPWHLPDLKSVRDVDSRVSGLHPLPSQSLTNILLNVHPYYYVLGVVNILKSGEDIKILPFKECLVRYVVHMNVVWEPLRTKIGA